MGSVSTVRRDESHRVLFARHIVFAAVAVASLASAAMVAEEPAEANATQITVEAGFIGELLAWVENFIGRRPVDDPPVDPSVW